MAHPLRRFSARLIQASVLILAGVAILSSLLDVRPGMPAPTPFEALGPDQREVARFASQARHAVLPGSTFTVSASTPVAERHLWRTMLAFSGRRSPVPPWDPAAGDARFIVSLGRTRRPAPDVRFVVGFDHGAVWERNR